MTMTRDGVRRAVLASNLDLRDLLMQQFAHAATVLTDAQTHYSDSVYDDISSALYAALELRDITTLDALAEWLCDEDNGAGAYILDGLCPTLQQFLL